MNSDLPFLRDIKVMGYSLRSWDYRYTLWLGFDPNTFKVGVWPSFCPSTWRSDLICWRVKRINLSSLPDRWAGRSPVPSSYSIPPRPRPQANETDIHGGELYMLADDPLQDHNLYSPSDHSQMLRKTSGLRHVG